MTVTTARADRLRNDDRILRAAARVLGTDPTASIQAVADAAGVSRLTVYRRYPDRDALVGALRAEADHDLDTALDGLPDWDDGHLVVAQLVGALAEVAARYPVALLRYAPVPGATPAADARIVELLRAGQRAGALRDDLAPEILNAAIFGVLSAVLAAGDRPDGHADAHPAGQPAARRAGHQAAQAVTTLLLPGLTSVPSAAPSAAKGST